jgi:16S rRNA (adenine1518-N6/adenine1519-N6)-dimethyltransferase
MVESRDYSSLAERASRYRKQKSLGQCFLIDESIHEQIVQSASLDKDSDVVLEIGAGIGFLTERLIPLAKEVYAVELDSSACFHLDLLSRLNKNFKFFNQDFLQFKLPELIPHAKKIKIVANIPYQITTKIILHLLGEIGFPSENQAQLDEIYILVQKEYAERLIANLGTKQYSALTHFVSYWAETEYLFTVEPKCFQPAPKVTSAFIKIKLRDKPLVETDNPKQLRRFIKAIFANRRKVLTNALKAAGYTETEIKSLNLDPKLRGETLSLAEINALTQKLELTSNPKMGLLTNEQVQD